MFGAPDARAVAGADEEPDPGADAVPDAAARACVARCLAEDLY